MTRYGLVLLEGKVPLISRLKLNVVAASIAIAIPGSVTFEVTSSGLE